MDAAADVDLVAIGTKAMGKCFAYMKTIESFPLGLDTYECYKDAFSWIQSVFSR